MAKLDAKTALDLINKGRFAEAHGILLKLLPHAPDNAALLELLGATSSELGKHNEAVAHFERAVRLSPSSLGPRLNLGKALHRAGRAGNAVSVLRDALRLGSGMADAHLAYGAALVDAGHREEALESFAEAIRIEPASAKAHFNFALVLYRMGEHVASLAAWKQFLQLDPHSVAARFSMAACRQHLCLWDGYQENLAELERFADSKAGVTGAAFFSLLAWDDPRLHRKCAELAVAAIPEARAPAVAARARARPQGRIRLGYVSADFCAHPIARLIADLFETHDRDRFEVVAVALKDDDNSSERARVGKAVDVWLDAHADTVDALQRRLRDLQLTIAIDLMAHTSEARLGVFAKRVAPIQVNYLGYPGTSAMPNMDYLVVDPFIATDRLRRTASEKLVILPDCYQCCDSKRTPAAELEQVTRASCGLPEDAFVFASFNQVRKITPEVFDVWMRILQQVESSVLWLLASTEKPIAGAVAANLRQEAERRGVAGDRLIFAGRVPNARHQARIALADLHLDTFPYGAHTTANDALWAGAPILTRAGATFPSRVCGSLLTTIGVPELIVEDWTQYEALAVSLARDKAARNAIKARIAEGRVTSALFDTQRFCRNLERAYEAMVAASAAGKQPTEIDLRRLS